MILKIAKGIFLGTLLMLTGQTNNPSSGGTVTQSQVNSASGCSPGFQGTSPNGTLGCIALTGGTTLIKTLSSDQVSAVVINSALAGNDTTSYALRQTPQGDTVVNSVAGHTVRFRMSDVDMGYFDVNSILNLAAGVVSSGPGVFTSLRTGASSNKDTAGQLTLSGGTASFTFTGTYATAPICTATDTTAIAATRVQTTTTTLTITGTTTDTINYICVGRT